MKGKEIEFRSEEVQEVMGQIPAWIQRWGITLLFAIVIILLFGSCFFKYPDVISTAMTLTSHRPVAKIIPKNSGRIDCLYVSDGERVSKGTYLAVIENPAVTGDVLQLKESLAKVVYNPDSAIALILPISDLRLGTLQTSYTNFIRALHNYSNQKKLNYYSQKIASVEEQIRKYQIYLVNIEKQYQVIVSQYMIAEKQYTRDSLLFVRKVISPSEYETSQKALLQSRYSLEGAKASLNNLRIQIGELTESLLDLRLQRLEKENVLIQEYSTTAEQLMNDITSWELNYILTSPIDGRVTFTDYWNENQNLTSDEIAFTVVPTVNDLLIGTELLQYIKDMNIYYPAYDK